MTHTHPIITYHGLRIELFSAPISTRQRHTVGGPWCTGGDRPRPWRHVVARSHRRSVGHRPPHVRRPRGHRRQSSYGLYALHTHRADHRPGYHHSCEYRRLPVPFPVCHYSDVTWTFRRPKSRPFGCLFNRWFMLTVNKNSPAPHFWSCVRGIHWRSVDSPHQRVVIYHDVIMNVWGHRRTLSANDSNDVTRRLQTITCSLIHWGRVTHICVGKTTIIGSDNGLSRGWRQAIIWTNAGILLLRPLGTHFNELLIEILAFSFMKMRLKVSSAKWRPYCLGLNVLKKLYLKMSSAGWYWRWAENRNTWNLHFELLFPPKAECRFCDSNFTKWHFGFQWKRFIVKDIHF